MLGRDAMSAKCGPVASMLSVALLVGLAPAQEPTKTAEQLRKENAELRKENATLKQKLKALDTRARREGARRDRERQQRMAAFLLQRQKDNAAEASRAKPSPPIPDKDFLRALNALTQARRKLGQSKEPAKAKAVVDEMERILGDARRALWKLEQAEKQKKIKSPAKK